MQVTTADVREAVQRSNATKTIKGVPHVWDVFENGWVTQEYWEFVNGRSAVNPAIRTHDTD